MESESSSIVVDRDPVCGMTARPESPHRFEYRGKVYLFCCGRCKEKFQADPERHLAGGPAGMKIEGANVRVEFDHVGGGLASRDGKPLTWFELAGEDKVWHEATAEIDGNAVVVSSPAVPKPVAVRFGWSMLAEPNLMNKEGLPAAQFRSHKW